MKRDYYESPKAGFIMRSLWKAAGSDEYTLNKGTYSDQVKYASLGGIVVATGFMAALAGGYAFYTIFEPKGVASEMGTDIATALKSAVFGLIWGLIIFNIDRFIVAATGKGDGTEKITASEFTNAIPRIIMGLVIAITISKPMEIRMFKSEIDVKLVEKQDELAQVFIKNKTVNINEYIKIEKDKIANLKTEIDKSDAKYFDLLEKFNKEMGGQAGARGYGPEAKKLEGLMERQNSDKTVIKNKNNKLILIAETKLVGYESKLKNIQIEAKESVKGLDGLLERIKLAHEVAGSLITWFITLLFVVIELTPIFFKMMLIKSPYDFMQDNVKDLLKAEEGIQIKYDYYKDKDGQERNLVINHKAKSKINEKMALIKAQTELSDYIIEKWKNEEMEKIDNNVNDYISE
jgi:hypothetical protein|tara:strand:- start:3223 stop:4437 length:1215 start_codon:yes stop_codon:yes gene_type:complete